MKKTIVIEDVPEEIYDGLVRRAELQGQSLEELLMGEFKQLALRPPEYNDEWLERVRARVKASGNRISAEEILRFRDEDRR